LPIAVVHGPATASAGEGVVMAPGGRPGVRAFGRGTAWVPTGNVGVEFSDGSVINLTVAVGVDFAGEMDETFIAPHVAVGGASTRPTSPACGSPTSRAVTTTHDEDRQAHRSSGTTSIRGGPQRVPAPGIGTWRRRANPVACGFQDLARLASCACSCSERRAPEGPPSPCGSATVTST
jgi:hypothetical protein